MGSVIPNGIGKFAIGVSQIGTRPALDYVNTLLSQYANSPTLVQLISNYSTYINPAAQIDSFFDMLWNVDTAQGAGLDVWGRIVGVTRVLTISGKFFGFDEAGTISADPFYQSPFYTGPTVTNNYTMADSAFRTLIYAKALANVTNGSVQSINQLLLALFPNRGACYVVDYQNMTMCYFFHFTLTPVEIAIVTQSGVLPKPAGVSVTYVNG